MKRQTKKTVSKTKQSPLKKSVANSFMAIQEELTGNVNYGIEGGTTGAVISTGGGGGSSVRPSVDPDRIINTNIDPIVSEVLIVPGQPAIVNPEIKSPADSPVVPIGIPNVDPVQVNPPDISPANPGEQTLTPTVDNSTKKTYAWLLLVVIAVAVVYFLAKKK